MEKVFASLLQRNSFFMAQFYFKFQNCFCFCCPVGRYLHILSHCFSNTQYQNVKLLLYFHSLLNVALFAWEFFFCREGGGFHNVQHMNIMLHVVKLVNIPSLILIYQFMEQLKTCILFTKEFSSVTKSSGRDTCISYGVSHHPLQDLSWTRWRKVCAVVVLYIRRLFTPNFLPFIRPELPIKII